MRLILCFICPRPGVSHFSRDAQWLLCSRNWYLETKIWALGVFFATGGFTFSSSFVLGKFTFCPTWPYAPSERISSFLLLSSSVSFTLWLIHVWPHCWYICSSHWTLSWLRVKAMLTSFLNSSIHQSINSLIEHLLCAKLWSLELSTEATM